MIDGKKNIQYVAEISINHLGMVNITKACILAAKNSGAHYVKLKIKNVSKYYTSKSVKKWNGYNFVKYRSSLELSDKDFNEINNYCKEIKMPWFATVHDTDSLELLKKYNVPLFKIASSDNKNIKLVNSVISICKEKKVPLVISLGGLNNKETDDLVSLINKNKIEAYLLHVVSIYPTPIGQSHINNIDHLIARYQSKNIKIGYSGHEIGIASSLIAAQKGISIIERHITLSDEVLIHHINAALTPSHFKLMIDLIEEMSIESAAINTSPNQSKFLIDKEYE